MQNLSSALSELPKYINIESEININFISLDITKSRFDTIIMFKILQVLSIFFIAFISVSNAENEESIDVLEALNLKEKKYLFASPKTTKKIFESTIARINNDCCDEDFPKKKRIIEIKETIEKCLSTKCQNKLIPIYVPKKPPLKLIAYKMNNEIEDLLFEHQNFKYKKLIKEIKIENSDSSGKDKEIKKLKSTIDKMLKNYQKKISNLKEENKKLNENYDMAYEMLSKPKQKKLDKIRE